jgi:hypothetical protein
MSTDTDTQTTDHKIVSREEWAAAREELLAREKEHTRQGDELARQRRELPWVRLEREYRFDTDEGEKPLDEPFDGRSQLLVYHFMFGPSYQAGCPVNSSIADTVDGVLPHLHARDVTFLLVSQARLEQLQPYKRRMGWRLPWSRRRARTSTSTSGSRGRRTKPARLWRRCEPAPVAELRAARFRRSSSRTRGRQAPIRSGTSPKARGSAPSYATATRSITPTRRRGADWSSSWATTRSSTVRRRAETRATRGSSGWIRRHDEYENG